MKKKLIYINAVVFVLAFFLKIVFLLFRLDGFQEIVSYLEMPSGLNVFMRQPWSLVTYMFLHYDVLHVLFNMLWLYWLADLFLNVYSQRHLVGLYILGGIGGAALFVCAYNIFPYFSNVVESSYLLGASASVLSVMGALLYRIPNHEFSLFLFGRIKFKYIALFIIAFDLLLLMNNPGQHFAHLGGILTGLLFAFLYARNVDLTAWINWIIDHLVSLFRIVFGWFVSLADRFVSGRKPKMKVHYGNSDKRMDYESNMRKREDEMEIDSILEKIKKSGYGSLSNEEKRKLFDASRK